MHAQGYMLDDVDGGDPKGAEPVILLQIRERPREEDEAREEDPCKEAGKYVVQRL